MVAFAAKAAPTSANQCDAPDLSRLKPLPQVLINVMRQTCRGLLSPVEGKSRSHKYYLAQAQEPLPRTLLTEALAGFGVDLARLDFHLHRFLIIASRHFNGVVIAVHIDRRVDARVVRVSDFVVLGG